jgi:Ca-activated chloride channel family protein
MHFGTPHFFWFILLMPVLVGFFIWAYQRRQEALRRFAEPKLLRRLIPGFRLSRQILKWTLFLAAFFFLVLALVQPRFGVKMEMVERKGVDIMMGLDISESMLAQDIAPDRIERAKHEIAQMIGLLKGDRIGIIVFAGEAFVQCPLTLDYGAATMFLDVVTTDWVQVQGTALGGAMDLAMQSFKSQSKKGKVLILLTDGEDHEGNALETARKVAAEGIRIYTIGIGSENGVPIPLQKSGGNVIYKKDNSGNLVLTKLDQMTLEKIAAETGGRYFHAGTDLNLGAIYEEIMKLEKADLGINKISVYEEQYQWFLSIALVLLLLEFFIPDRVRATAEWKGRVQ